MNTTAITDVLYNVTFPTLVRCPNSFHSAFPGVLCLFSLSSLSSIK